MNLEVEFKPLRNLDVDFESAENLNVEFEPQKPLDVEFKVVAYERGLDGFSPTLKVEQLEDGVKLVATDKDGTTEAEVQNGSDVQITEVKKIVGGHAMG